MFYLFSLLFFGIILVWFLFIWEILNFLFSLNFLSLCGGVWFINLDFDIVTLGVIAMLVVCFTYVYFYTGHYFGSGNIGGMELNKIICLFVSVMGILVCTGDFLSTLIFWEYLGVVSFFLILFYDSYLSLRSSVITLVSSRFGDVSLFLLIMISCFSIGGSASLVSFICFLLVILTKSASFPFTSWLLEAMRAPTPVSSLVHSSTLVAAGVWFCMRYDIFIFINSFVAISLLLLLTIFITALCCFFFVDLKKIVALSTCNNISWCIFYLLFGDSILSLFQLISHGVSKCMLFMSVGDVMSGSSGSQSVNCVYSPCLYSNWSIFSMLSLILGLSGAPFVGVFFTKHFLLTNFNNLISISLVVIVYLCVFMSYFYSFRLCSILINSKSSISTGVLFFFDSSLMICLWLLVNFFISFYLDEVSMLNSFDSLSLILFQGISCIIAYYCYDNSIFSRWSSSLFGCDNIVEVCYSLFFYTLGIVSLFFYRWDSKLINLFNGMGVNTISSYGHNLLNIILLSSIMILFISWIVSV